MRKLDELPAENPVTAWEPMFKRYPPSTEIGRELRRGVAEMWLHDLDAAEAEIPVWKSLHAEIADRIDRLAAEHDLRMQCLVHFGATSEEFAVFRTVLEEVVVRGHLTISEAAARAHSLAQRNGDPSPGDDLGSSSGSSIAGGRDSS